MSSFETAFSDKVLNGLSNQLPDDQCLGVVLAGGLSSRMGKDKAKLQRNDTDMLNFSKQLLINSGVKSIIVSGDDYDVPDKVKQSGPVGGIYSVLSKFPQAKSLLILPVDLPFMTTKTLTDLRTKGELSQKATYFEGHNIPLFLPNSAYIKLFFSKTFTRTALSDSSCVDTLQTNKWLINSYKSSEKTNHKHGPSIKALLQDIPNQAIKCNDSKALFNTNTPQQWQQAIKQFDY
jgi:molybdopterin-guanine dinucleotide biosynthesis protein A